MTEEERDNEEVIDNLLKSWNLVRHNIPRAGNCLFSSVAFSLQMQLKRGNTDLKTILDKNKIDSEDSLSQMAMALRVCVVKEWLGENSEYYQQWMTEGQLLVQAEKFLEDGLILVT